MPQNEQDKKNNNNNTVRTNLTRKRTLHTLRLFAGKIGHARIIETSHYNKQSILHLCQIFAKFYSNRHNNRS